MFENLDIKYGKNVICDSEFYPDMLMDVSVHLLKSGEELVISSDNKESAVLLLTGKVELEFLGEKYLVERSDVFGEKPYCVHFSKKDKVLVKAVTDTELLIQQKENDVEFELKYYTQDSVNQIIAGQEEYDSTSKRIIRTIFDYSTAPYSNMVLGEVLSYTGRWNSYPPHHHPQPEVYFYKFDHPSGFGVSVIGDEAAVIKNNSASYIPGGLVHPQATAPGYRMFYVWMIPHFENNPWTERIFEEKHTWLLK